MRTLAVLAITLLLLPAQAAFAIPQADAGCHAGSLDEAARILVHPDASIASRAEDSAVALAPLIHPGVRFALVQFEGAWCDAQKVGAWPTGDAVARASAYARFAAAPWFDGVEVTSARELLPGLVALTTHARTNGIVAEWIIRVDAQGIAEARWTATAFAVAPFDAEHEGLTALPGATRAFIRGPDGLLAPDVPIIPAVTPTAPSITAVERMSDGFRIQFNYIATGIYPALGEPVPLDVIRAVTRENYEEYLTWGLQKGWTGPQGLVHVDDSLALQCIACVIISQNFQIHISSAVVLALRALGYEYEDDRAALSTVIGHEMFHNFQNAYSKPAGGVFMTGAYSEGLARFQETLHIYSAVSHQPRSLVYAPEANGCNDELSGQTSRTVHDGPATAQSYSACDFWMTWYAEHGRAGLLRLFEASPQHRAKNAWDEVRSVVETATDAPIDDDLARFAARILTGDGLTWGPASGGGDPIAWSTYLDRLSFVPFLAAGSSRSQVLRDGGIFPVAVATDGIVTVDTPATPLYVIGTDGSITRISSGASVTAPAWIVAVHPGDGAVTPTLSYS